MGLFNAGVRTQLISLSATVGIALSLAIGSGYLLVNDTNSGLQRMSEAAQALRNQMNADMMHDALRADVLAAIKFSTNKEKKIETLKDIEKDLKEHSATFEEAMHLNTQLAVMSSAQKQMQGLLPKLKNYLNTSQSLIHSTLNGKTYTEKEFDTFMNDFSVLEKEMNDLDNTVEQIVKIESLAAQQHLRQGALNDAMLILVAMICVLLLCYYIGRNILASLGGEPAYVRSAVQEIAQGNTKIRLKLDPKDKHSLLAAMHSMQRVINQLIDSQTTLTTFHQQGHIHERLESHLFPGSFKEVADGLNTLIEIHTRVQNSMLQTIRAYAKGDFSVQPETFPGDLAAITTGLSGVKSNLLSISQDIKLLVDSAVQGNFKPRGHPECYDYSFKEIMINQNRLMETNENIFENIKKMAIALSEGDLSCKPLPENYPGIFGSTALALNQTVHTLSELMHDVQSTVLTASQGNYSNRINAEHKRGVGKELSELLNQLNAMTEEVLQSLLHVSRAMAQGDLTQRISKDYPGTLGAVSGSLTETIGSLKTLITKTMESASQISSASSQINMGNNDLAQRTSEQASNVEQVTTSLNELVNAVEYNAKDALDAKDLSSEATHVAHKGKERVASVIETMEIIRQSAAKVSDIISVIDSIAFQTNILALNAAVEAARAGEQGRGFAVVASEVRNLAQRSAQAAKEIKTLITDSVTKVALGTEQVQTTGDTMDAIVASVQNVNTLVSNISTSCQHQVGKIQALNFSMQQMDSSTQKNAALVEEVAAASESLQDEAQLLMNSIGVFNV
jgi:methyl-accepting chemotaxis protein